VEVRLGEGTLILKLLNLKLACHDVQAQVVSQAVEVMRTMKLDVHLEPEHEQAHAELVQVIESGLLRRGMRVIVTKEMLKVRALLLELFGAHVDGLLVPADVESRLASVGSGGCELVRLLPVHRSGESVVLGGRLNGSLWKWDEAGTSCSGLRCSCRGGARRKWCIAGTGRGVVSRSAHRSQVVSVLDGVAAE